MSTDATRCKKCGGEFASIRVVIDGQAYHQRCSVMSHPPHTWEDYARLSDDYERLRKAISDLHRVWFTGIDVDKDAVTVACLALFRAAFSPADGGGK